MFTFLPVIILLFAITIYAVYFLLISAWLMRRLGRLVTLISLITVSVGFILIFVALNFYDNFLLRQLYLLLSLLIGWLFYLTMFGILFRFITFFKLSYSNQSLARIGIFCATVLFIIGVIYTFFFHIKTIEIKIDNLPEKWCGQKIVQISDLHLGNIHGSNFLQKVAGKIKTLNPDYLIITGDLFDGHPGQLAKLGPELQDLSATKRVIFIPGNHDKYLGLDEFSGYLKQANILSLVDEAVTIDGLEIIGYDYLDKEWRDQRQVKNISTYQGQPRLLLNHAPIEISKAKDLHVSLQLSGHSHGGQMWPISLFTELIYGKYQYGLHTEGAYNIYTTSGVGSWGPPLRTFNRPEIVQIILK